MIHRGDSLVDLAQEADMLDLAIVQQSFVAEEYHSYIVDYGGKSQG